VCSAFGDAFSPKGEEEEEGKVNRLVVAIDGPRCGRSR